MAYGRLDTNSMPVGLTRTYSDINNNNNNNNNNNIIIIIKGHFYIAPFHIMCSWCCT